MRCSGLARSCGAVPPISQRPLRRSTTFRGQQPCPWSGCPDHRLALGLPRAGWPGNYPSPKTLSFPKAQRLQVFPVPWLRAFFSPHDPGFPPRPSNSSFPFAGWLRAFFSPYGSGFPLRQLAQSFPFAGGAGLLLARRPGFVLCRVAPGSPSARGLEITHCRWPGVSPEPGGSEFPPRLRRQAPPCPKAWICPLPGGSGFPPYRWLGVSPLPVARGFPSAGYRPGGRRISTPIAGDRTRGFGQQFQDSLAVHKPSTVNPRLSPATGLSPPNTPQDDPQGGCLPGRRAGQPSSG